MEQLPLQGMDTSKKRSRVAKALTTVTIIGTIVTVLLGFSIMGNVRYYTEIKPAKDAEIFNLSAIVKSLQKTAADYLTELTDLRAMKSEFDSLARNNVADMTDYIKARYSKVPQELAELIANVTNEKCKEHDVPFATIVGVMEVESQFNPFAVSNVGALGLLQVMPKIWSEPLGLKKPSDLHDITTGIDSGIRVYKHYLDQENGNIKRALNLYNGSNAETGGYADKIFESIGRFTTFRNNPYRKKAQVVEQVASADVPRRKEG